MRNYYIVPHTSPPPIFLIHAKRNNKEVNEKEWNVPEEYLGIPLDKEARENLLKIIGFPKGWTSFKKWLAINKYKITEKRVDNKRYQIIS